MVSFCHFDVLTSKNEGGDEGTPCGDEEREEEERGNALFPSHPLPLPQSTHPDSPNGHPSSPSPTLGHPPPLPPPSPPHSRSQREQFQHCSRLANVRPSVPKRIFLGAGPFRKREERAVYWPPFLESLFSPSSLFSRPEAETGWGREGEREGRRKPPRFQ